MPAVIVPPAGGYAIGAPVLDPLLATRRAIFLGDAIDPITGDYRSIQRGVDPLEARLLEKLLVRRRSGSACMEHGQKFHEIEFVDDKASALLKSEIEFAWGDEIRNREIEITKLENEEQNDAIWLTVRFKRVGSDQDGKVSLPLLQLQGRLQ